MFFPGQSEDAIVTGAGGCFLQGEAPEAEVNRGYGRVKCIRLVFSAELCWNDPCYFLKRPVKGAYVFKAHLKGD